MAGKTFTPEQQQAITAHGGSILVSAAAGSGKTTVLIERIMRMLTDEEQPHDADRLLVCTFTRASTAEMRSRLNAELARRLADNPHDLRLRRQKLLLQKSHITTIHSFCLACVREYFSLAGVAPDFRIGDDSELRLLKNDILDELIEECYLSMDEPSRVLIELLSDSRGNTSLGQVITDIDGFLSAFSDPDGKLRELSGAYRCGKAPEDTDWGNFLLGYIGKYLSYLIRLCERMTDDASRIDELCDSYTRVFEKDAAQLRSLLSIAAGNDWDGLRAAVSRVKFPALPRTAAAEGKEKLRSDRDYIKKQLERICSIMSVDSAGFSADAEQTAPVAERLCALVAEYRKRCAEKKAERKLLDCDDLEHLAAKLLVTEKNGRYYRTDAAKELSARFDEILIDEYQDTNYTQDLIFRAVAREDGDLIGDGCNMFMVGDIKQSIYGFRKAVPKLFLERLNRYAPYDEGNPVFPAKIILGQNFRSRREVTDAVNFVFSQLMTPERGGIDYNDGQQLICSGSFPPSDCMTAELHLLELPARDDREEDENVTRDSFEADYCAALISKMISDGFTVTGTDSNGNRVLRPAVYGDFCIMRRAVSGEHGQVFADRLSAAGIPVRVGTTGGFFRTPEISVILSLLRAINNPLLDIPLAAALRSPIFGFDCSMLASLRTDGSRTESLYVCLNRCAQHGNKQCADVLGKLKTLRDMACTLPADRLISYILRTTGFLSAVQSTVGGAARKANLLRLLEYARSFESFGYKGLSRFIRTLDRMLEAGEDLPAADSSVSDDCVTVRTMHGAKGLEFPICIVAGLGSNQNTDSVKGGVITSGELGLGIYGYEPDKRLRYSNIQRDAVALSCFCEETNEELRILYVTMTRASEKLIMLSTSGSIDSQLRSAAKLVFPNGIDPFSLGISPSPAKWLLACALRMPSADDLREAAYVNENVSLGSYSPIKIIIPDGKAALPAATERLEVPVSAEPTPELIEEISKRISYVYPYNSLRFVPSKVTASGAVKHFEPRPSAVRPAFADSDGLSAAQKGTALHKLLELCGFDALERDPAAEIERLCTAGMLTRQEGECIDISAVGVYIRQLAPLISSAERIEREWRFSVNLEERFLGMFTEYDAMGEPVILQGECDLLLINGRTATIIDYKTDKLTDRKRLTELYTPQLELYASAVRSSFDVDTVLCRLYSFFLGELIELDVE